MTVEEQVEQHRAAGRSLVVEGVRTFVRDQGEGEAVLCVHGVPVSSYVWRRLLPELAARGLRGVAPDLLGLGLTGRPARADYSWTGLGAHLAATVDALGLDRLHLVVHDIGGPVGLEAAARLGDRVASVTLLDTVVVPHTFTRPWMMEPFAHRGLGEAWLAGMRGPAFRRLVRAVGSRTSTREELDAHLALLRREDGGRAFLKIMRSFERTPEKSALYARVLQQPGRPVQVVWATGDPALPLARYGEQAGQVAGVPVQRLPGLHFFQEDVPGDIADRVAALVARAP